MSRACFVVLHCHHQTIIVRDGVNLWDTCIFKSKTGMMHCMKKKNHMGKGRTVGCGYCSE